MKTAKILVFAGAAVALIAGSFMYPHNQKMTRLLLENLSQNKPAMQGVEYRIPFLPYKEKVVVIPRYPESIVFGDDASLKFRSLDGDYWATPPFKMEGEVLEDKLDYKAHVRFKYCPPDDPIHPGYALISTQSDEHRVAFQRVGGLDFYGIEKAPLGGWGAENSVEIPGVWKLEAGNIVLVRITTPTAVKDAKGKSKSVDKVTYAKFFVKKLSREEVIFDYVYQTDGTNLFPRPHLPKAEEELPGNLGDPGGTP
ncbi:MAG: hypothetical protein ACM3YO_04075 [Bacteroidota bacterium]